MGLVADWHARTRSRTCQYSDISGAQAAVQVQHHISLTVPATVRVADSDSATSTESIAALHQ